MEPYFSDHHAAADSQLGDKEYELTQSADSYDGWMHLGKELGHELRYREAILAYTKAIDLSPGRIEAYRQRGGKYLATLQPEAAMADFERCRTLGGEESDLSYRMGLSWFFSGVYSAALREFSHCWDVCDDELGIGAIYWSMIAAWRLGIESPLLQYYHEKMTVGHHTAYAFAVKTALGYVPLEEALRELDMQDDDLEFSMMGYGLATYCARLGKKETSQSICQKILRRDRFWISFGYLATWNDCKA